MSDNYIGHIIKETRLKKQISSSKLCAGLCSPSMLTRIESGERYPSKLLFDALMERMGESGKNYNFIGSPREAELHHLLDLIVTYYSQRNYEQVRVYVERYRKIMNPKDKLELQHLYINDLLLNKETLLDKYEVIITAINLTIPNFNYKKIQYYMLSNQELSLINALGGYYSLTDHLDEAIHVFKSIQFLLDQYTNLDNSLLHISSVIKYNLVVTYLRKKDYAEMLYLCQKSIPTLLTKHQDIFLGRVYYQKCYAALTLDSFSRDSDIILAYYTYLDVDDKNYAEHLKNDIQTDLGLSFEISFY